MQRRSVNTKTFIINSRLMKLEIKLKKAKRAQDSQLAFQLKKELSELRKGT